jgi:hypothetical protein
LEDTEALSLLLSHNVHASNDRTIDSDVLAKTFKQYIEVRKAHVEDVLDVGNRAGDTSRDMGVAKEYMMYGAMWLACKYRLDEGPMDCQSLQLTNYHSQAIWRLFRQGDFELQRYRRS